MELLLLTRWRWASRAPLGSVGLFGCLAGGFCGSCWELGVRVIALLDAWDKGGSGAFGTLGGMGGTVSILYTWDLE